VNLGVLPGTGGTQRLGRLVGKAKAIELMVEGTNMSVSEAQAAGLINKVFDAPDAEAFLAQVLDYAKGMCPPTRASKAVRLIKRAVQGGLDVGLSEGLALERELQQRLFESEDAAEGIRAYNERRAPVFKGR